MSSFNKKYIIREAEGILEECNKNIDSKDEKIKINQLRKECNKLKKKNIFWKITTAIVAIMFLMVVV